jgi:hypothetical protein
MDRKRVTAVECEIIPARIRAATSRAWLTLRANTEPASEYALLLARSTASSIVSASVKEMTVLLHQPNEVLLIISLDIRTGTEGFALP